MVDDDGKYKRGKVGVTRENRVRSYDPYQDRVSET